jgi:hypothetical protein
MTAHGKEARNADTAAILGDSGGRRGEPGGLTRASGV